MAKNQLLPEMFSGHFIQVLSCTGLIYNSCEALLRQEK